MARYSVFNHLIHRVKVCPSCSNGNPKQTDLKEGGLDIVGAKKDWGPGPIERQLGGVEGEREHIASISHHQVARIAHSTILQQKIIFLLSKMGTSGQPLNLQIDD